MCHPGSWSGPRRGVGSTGFPRSWLYPGETEPQCRSSVTRASPQGFLEEATSLLPGRKTKKEIQAKSTRAQTRGCAESSGWARRREVSPAGAEPGALGQGTSQGGGGGKPHQQGGLGPCGQHGARAALSDALSGVGEAPSGASGAASLHQTL